MRRKERVKMNHAGIRHIGTLFLTIVMLLMIVCPVLAAPYDYGITLKQTEHGTISCDSTRATKDQVIKVTAVPDEGYRLAFVFFDDETVFVKRDSEGENERFGWMPGKDSVISAQFVPKDQYGILVTRNNQAGGTVTLSKASGKTGDEITVRVHTNDGYLLKDELYDDGTAVYEIGDKFKINDADVLIKVNFQKKVKNYTDVPKDSWYTGAVNALTARGIMGGVSDTEFAPNGKVTRAQLCQTIYAMENRPAVFWRYGFSDVPEGKWYTDAVNWCAQKRYVIGYPDRTFRPDQVITREQMALILYQFNKDVQNKSTTVNGNKALQYKDSDQISDYARTAMLWAVDKTLLAGTGNGKLEPQGEVTRAQLAVILYRFLPEPAPD